jgi:hypothetical protein
MKISYERFTEKFLNSVIELEKEWADENITYGTKQFGEKLLAKIEEEAKGKRIKHIFVSTSTKDTDTIIRVL